MKRFTCTLIAFIMAFMLVVPVLAHDSDYTPVNTGYSNMDQLWWMVSAARGNGEFSYEFELAPSAAQVEAGTHGQRGIVEGRDGVVRVFNRNADGTYTEVTNSVAMALFARNFRLLTQAGAASSADVAFPEWLGLTDNGEATNLVLLPLIAHSTLVNAADTFDVNLQPAAPERAMMFVFESGEISAVHMTDHNGNNVFKRITNLQPALSGVTSANRSTKTYLWWIIDAARGNGEFSYEFELAPSAVQIEAGTHGQRGIVEGRDGVIRVFHRTADGTYTETTNSVAMALFANNFRLLTQRNHNHNNEIEGVRPYEPPFPEWLGLTNDGVGFVNSNYELFPLVTHETLANAANPFEMNLLSPDPNRENAMLFIYDGGAMSAVQFRNHNGDYVFKRISNLQPNLSGVTPTNLSTKTYLWWIINAARGNGEFSFNFEFEDGTRGRVTGADGVIRALDEANNEAPNSPALTVFANRFALLTQLNHNHNNEIEGVRPYEPPFPEWLGLTNNGVGFVNSNYELFPLVTHETLANAANPFEMNLLSPDPYRQNAMLFIYDGGAMSAVQFRNHNGDYIFKRISNLQPTLSGVTPARRSTKTYLWWIINAARGNGEFSFNFEFEDGTRGRVTGADGVVRAFDEANNETPNSPALTIFGNRFALLTQLNHNHNNEIEGVRPYEPPFPEWLGLTNNGIGFVNSNYELFPLVTPETLANTANPFEMNLLSPDPNRLSAMLFIYDDGAMSAVQFRDPATGDYVFMRIYNLQDNVGEHQVPDPGVADDWENDEIQSAIEKGFVPANIQNNLTSFLTRQEFSQMAVMWVEYVMGSPIADIVAEHGIPERMGHTFSDTANPYIIAAYRLGIINGTVAPIGGNPGIFNPNGRINRQQAATIIMNASRAIGINVGDAPVSGFADINLSASWARQGINFVDANGIMSGVDNNRFDPLGYFTREMGIVTFYNINYNELLNR